ncbi:MFS general substrate transporter [Gymnopus androsaceus JB14]|uniref:MFS general substrate transporter n=1 Tax=Gymnopus androsaceus JB14 TaxID=1447944 RepID=A0A6A4HJ08_9AGAR|nr:MFS general substrate transporter [Gymnopus androsaceus JB14]
MDPVCEISPNAKEGMAEVDMKGTISHIEAFVGSEKDFEYANEDAATFHEREAGRLILDPAQARVEFGEVFTSRLKLTEDGSTILWPQPTDDPLDPQNWSSRKKAWHLMIMSLAATLPTFDFGIAIASVFPLSVQFHTTTGEINDLTSNWAVFLQGWGGIFAIILMHRYGRLPVLFWSQLLALGFLVGITFAPTIKVLAAMRGLNGFFGTGPQITGLFVINDMYPFHLRARMIGIWATAFIIGPHLSPFVFGFLVARASWRWAFGIGSIYGLLVLLLIMFGMEETMYDRKGIRKIIGPKGFWARCAILLGIPGWKTSSQAPKWKELIMEHLRIVWRPHFVGIYLYEAMVFGFVIGITITNTIFLQSPPPFGFGFSQTTVAAIYATPVVSVFIGEALGRYLNDWIMYYCVRHNDGVFEAESRLWACYISTPIYLAGFLLLGAAFQNHFSIAVVVVAWVLCNISYLMITVTVYAYCNDCFPGHQGAVSAILNLARTLGGFSVAYYQVPWSTKHGALQTLGLEAGIVCGLFVLVVPMLQYKGRAIRQRFSI